MVQAAGAYRAAVETIEAGGSAYALKLQRARGVRLLIQRGRDGRLAVCSAMLEDSGDTLGRLLRVLGVL